MTWLLHAFRDPDTLRVASYLLIGLPLGILEFTFVVSGLALGLGLLVTLIGIPMLVITLLAVRGMARLEGELARSLLRAPLPLRRPRSDAVTDLFWRRLRWLIADRDTWRAVAIALIRLPIGILDFTVLVTILSLALGGFAHPILFALGFDLQIGNLVIDSVAKSLIYLPFSLVFLVTVPRLLLGWGIIARRIVTQILGGIPRSEMKRDIAEILSRSGEADAFLVSNELKSWSGPGPFPSYTQVQAALVALQETGHVEGHQRGTRTVYRLPQP